ncbi:MAG: response regulator [Acidobacteria bacterium]|nr:response regulator [Acidobacteriota bacterium]
MAIKKLPKILVVDDEDEHLAILRKILEEAGYGVETCSSGHEALSKLRRNHYDAILCDMWMPGITGMGLYQMMKEEFPLYERQFVFITADVASEMTWEFIRTRNLPYVIKPFSPAELQEKLSEVVGDRLEAASEVRRDESNKRQDRRLTLKADVQVRQKKWVTGGPDTASLVDISRRGIRFFTNRQYWVGAEVLVTYPVTDPSALEQQGKIVRIEELRDGWRRVAVALNIGKSGGGEERRLDNGRRTGERRQSIKVYTGIQERRLEDRRSGLERRIVTSTASR